MAISWAPIRPAFPSSRTWSNGTGCRTQCRRRPDVDRPIKDLSPYALLHGKRDPPGRVDVQLYQTFLPATRLLKSKLRTWHLHAAGGLRAMTVRAQSQAITVSPLGPLG